MKNIIITFIIITMVALLGFTKYEMSMSDK